MKCLKQRKNTTGLFVILILLAAGVFVAVFGIGEGKEGSAAAIRQGLDLAGGVSITYQVTGEQVPDEEDMADTVYKLQKRMEAYSTEALVYQEGSNRINIEIPGVSDANAILKELGRPGSLIFEDAGGNVVLTGADVADARGGSIKNDMGATEYVVSLTLTGEGAAKFAQATAQAAPDHEIIRIIYDGEVVFAPMVQAEITDGRCMIQGMESYEEAETLASIIRIGGLRLTLEELRSNVVGAQLGSQAITGSLFAGLAGLLLIVAFMIGRYRIPGVAASIALIAYIVLMILLLNGFAITLTLSGIAGILLSIGMAVDANVIIFERIREEIAGGISVKGAIRQGFHKALSAIVDGNITTLIAALVLGTMVTGPIRGFSHTLALGIVISVFTSLVITRILVWGMYELGFCDVKYYGQADLKKTMDFLAKRKWWMGISMAVILLGFVAMGINFRSPMGEILNFSLEFKGGTVTHVAFPFDWSIEELDSQVLPVMEEAIGRGAIQTQKVQGSSEVIFKTETLRMEERERLQQTLTSQFGVKAEGITAESISPVIGREMKKDAALAVTVAVVCMLLYVALRFRDIGFGAAGVAALLHDVLVVLAFYAVAKISVGSAFIACMLTIVGYSINDTIVIFDRIREQTRSGRKEAKLYRLINESISQTLNRSIFTSLTTFVMVACLYVLGVASIREFALPLMAGIVCGAYSSVCLAGAFYYMWKKRFPGRGHRKEEGI